MIFIWFHLNSLYLTDYLVSDRHWLYSRTLFSLHGNYRTA